jgi:hypothetical protein
VQPTDLARLEPCTLARGKHAYLRREGYCLCKRVGVVSDLKKFKTFSGVCYTAAIQTAIHWLCDVVEWVGMAKQQFNRRLSAEAIAAINWWAKEDSTPARRVTDTEIVERAIAMYDLHRQRVVEAKPPTVVAVPMVVESKQEAPFHPTCRHCGETFGAWNRAASICSECKRSGHGGDARECSVCLLRQGGL